MVILNGIIGFAVTLYFIAMKAPDLALTQLVVETITTILFIVSFSRLPNIPRAKANLKKETLKIVVSLIMAVSVVSLILSLSKRMVCHRFQNSMKMPIN